MTTESVESYFGKISITKIDNSWPDSLSKNEALEMNNGHCRVVHYQDCQQLIIWLPAYWDLYEYISLILPTSNTVIWKKKISDVINGSVQIILDTLPLVPGEYSIIISKTNELAHHITFMKYEVGKFPEKIIEETSVDLDAPPIEYKDGFGNILPNEDLILRDAFLKKNMELITRRVEYISEGRSGKIIYVEGSQRVVFYMEMGGGNCIFYLDIPSDSQWEKNTGFSLERRDEIIHFVAEQTRRDQASNGHYKIVDTGIVFYHGLE